VFAFDDVAFNVLGFDVPWNVERWGVDEMGLSKIKIFADGASLPALRELANNPAISGFTTNPTLMRQAGVKDYRAFARSALEVVGGRPISFEVFADDFQEMERQALLLSELADNVYVKLPITNTHGASALPLVRRLSLAGVKINVTALCTLEQVEKSAEALRGGAPAVISVFAGRIADTGRDPVPLMREAVSLCSLASALDARPIELLWASPRELLNLIQAEQVGCHIITVTHDLLKKLPLIGKDLEEYSLETVRMFHRDASLAGYEL
jgi:transaldolase